MGQGATREPDLVGGGSQNTGARLGLVRVAWLEQMRQGCAAEGLCSHGGMPQPARTQPEGCLPCTHPHAAAAAAAGYSKASRWQRCLGVFQDIPAIWMPCHQQQPRECAGWLQNQQIVPPHMYRHSAATGARPPRCCRGLQGWGLLILLRLSVAQTVCR